MTTTEPTQREHRSTQGPMFLNGFKGVVRATGVETTLVTDERAQRPLINLNGELQRPARSQLQSHCCTRESASGENT